MMLILLSKAAQVDLELLSTRLATLYSSTTAALELLMTLEVLDMDRRPDGKASIDSSGRTAAWPRKWHVLSLRTLPPGSPSSWSHLVPTKALLALGLQ
jgi:hypothetical protein